MTRRDFLQAAGIASLPALLINCRDAPAQPVARRPDDLYAGDFRAPGLTDKDVLERAFAAWLTRNGTLHLEPEHEYDLGAHRDSSNLFELFGMREATIAGNGATLRVRTIGNKVYNFFYLAHYRNLRIENLRCIDDGFRGTAQAGAKFLVLDAGTQETVGLTLDNVAGERLVSFLHVQGRPGGPRVRGIRIMPNCRATHIFYAISCLDQGDDLEGGLSTFNCARSYFPYGVTNHRLDLRIHHQGAAFGPAAEAAVLIKSYGRRTAGLRLDVSFAGILACGGTCVALEHQHAPTAGPSVIEDIDLNIRIAPGTADPNDVPRILLRSYLPDGSLELGPTANIWRRIRVGGDLRPGRAPAIVSRAVPAAGADITILPGTTGADRDEIDAPAFRIQRLRSGG